MRIAYLINQYPKVSHSFIRREINALERLGFEVMRIAIRGWDIELVDEEDHVERKRTRYVLKEGARLLVFAFARTLLTRPLRLAHALALAWSMSRCADRPLSVHLIYLAEACRIQAWLRAADIRHLHAHFGTNSAEVAMLVNVLGGQRWSFTVHGPEEFDRALFIGLAKKVRQCTFVVTISSYGRSQLYRLVDYAHWPKVKLVRCGIDQTFHAIATVPAPAARRFVCVGRLCEQKGQLLLVEAAHQLATQGQDFELVLVGDGKQRSEIESLVARRGLRHRITITGWANGEQVRNEILAARALVLPSFAEGLPVVIMEAMALRRPIISTFVAGIPELVHPGEHGWLVPAGDVEALVEAMRACLDTPREALVRMGEAARQHVMRRHDVDAEAVKLATLFQLGT